MSKTARQVSWTSAATDGSIVGAHTKKKIRMARNRRRTSARCWRVRVLVVSQALAAIAGCGGGGGGGGDSEENQPYISIFVAEPANIEYGGSSWLRWTSVGTDSCVATGGWAGVKAASGSELVSAITQPTRYELRCSSARGSDDGVVLIRVPVVTAPPTVTLYSDRTYVGAGDLVRVEWRATPALGCTASGDWSGARDSAGSEILGPLSSSATLTLSCHNGLGINEQTLVVAVIDEPRLISLEFVQDQLDPHHEGEEPIPGEPAPGAGVLAATLSGPIADASVEFVDEVSGSIVGTASLGQPFVRESGVRVFVHDVIVPTDAFRMRVIGALVDGQPFELQGAEVKQPSQFSLAFDSLAGVTPGVTADVLLHMVYRGAHADAEQARAVCLAGREVSISPEVTEATFDGDGRATATLRITVDPIVPPDAVFQELRCLGMVTVGSAAGATNLASARLVLRDTAPLTPSP